MRARIIATGLRFSAVRFIISAAFAKRLCAIIRTIAAGFAAIGSAIIAVLADPVGTCITYGIRINRAAIHGAVDTIFRRFAFPVAACHGRAANPFFDLCSIGNGRVHFTAYMLSCSVQTTAVINVGCEITRPTIA